MSWHHSCKTNTTTHTHTQINNFSQIHMHTNIQINTHKHTIKDQLELVAANKTKQNTTQNALFSHWYGWVIPFSLRYYLFFFFFFFFFSTSMSTWPKCVVTATNTFVNERAKNNKQTNKQITTIQAQTKTHVACPKTIGEAHTHTAPHRTYTIVFCLIEIDTYQRSTSHITHHTSHSTQHTAHSTQHTAHNTQHTTHNTQQHTAHKPPPTKFIHGYAV